jgi:hypothetical protein
MFNQLIVPTWVPRRHQTQIQASSKLKLAPKSYRPANGLDSGEFRRVRAAGKAGMS